MLIKGILTLGILIVIGGLGLPYFGSGFLGIQDEGRAAKVVEFTRNLSDVMLTAQITDPAGAPLSDQVGGAASFTDTAVRGELGDLFSKELEVDQGIVMPGVATLTDSDADTATTRSFEVLVVSSDDLSDRICQDINKTLSLVDVEGEGLNIEVAATAGGFDDATDFTSGVALTAGELVNVVEGLESTAGGELPGMTDVNDESLEGICINNTAGDNFYVHVVGEL